MWNTSRAMEPRRAINSYTYDLVPIIDGEWAFQFLSDVSSNDEEAVEEVAIKFGAFISAILTFIILAFVVFLIVKAINKAAEKAKELKGAEEEPEEAPTTKVCPFCKSEIAIDATRCPHCTSELIE